MGITRLYTWGFWPCVSDVKRRSQNCSFLVRLSDFPSYFRCQKRWDWDTQWTAKKICKKKCGPKSWGNLLTHRQDARNDCVWLMLKKNSCRNHILAMNICGIVIFPFFDVVHIGLTQQMACVGSQWLFSAEVEITTGNVGKASRYIALLYIYIHVYVCCIWVYNLYDVRIDIYKS